MIVQNPSLHDVWYYGTRDCQELMKLDSFILHQTACWNSQTSSAFDLFNNGWRGNNEKKKFHTTACKLIRCCRLHQWHHQERWDMVAKKADPPLKPGCVEMSTFRRYLKLWNSPSQSVWGGRGRFWWREMNICHIDELRVVRRRRNEDYIEWQDRIGGQEGILMFGFSCDLMALLNYL